MIGGDFNRKVKGTEVIRRKHGNGFCQQHGNGCDERGKLDNAYECRKVHTGGLHLSCIDCVTVRFLKKATLTL